MKKFNLKKVGAAAFAGVAALALAAGLVGCGSSSNDKPAENTVYKVGVCNYVDHASLNQIVDSLQAQLDALGEENGVTFEVNYQNGNADDSIISQIISDFQADQVDVMVGVATPVAMSMQAATEDTGTPVVFSAVTDPLSVGLVDSLEAPGGNITGTSDYLNTDAIMKLIVAANPEIKTVGLLYDQGQDSSTAAIADAKAFCEANGLKVAERTGTTVDELQQAAQQLITDGAEAVFTPTDNTVMNAESALYEVFLNAGIPHYAGADSFALNGAFLGYGVDYENLGIETANMVFDILVNGADPAATAVKTFDNGIATVNTETAEAIGYTAAMESEDFKANYTKLVEVTTADNFSDLEKK